MIAELKELITAAACAFLLAVLLAKVLGEILDKLLSDRVLVWVIRAAAIALLLVFIAAALPGIITEWKAVLG